MDTLIQLARNGLCCIRDLDWLKETIPFLHDSKQLSQHPYLAPYFTLPHLSQSRPLDFCICLCQLYAFFSFLCSGYRLITSNGICKLFQLNRIISIRTKRLADTPKTLPKTRKRKDDAKKITALENQADQILTHSLISKANGSFQNTLVGMCHVASAVGFFYLAANSIHITETGVLGGTLALVHALTVMEVMLVMLLYYMIRDGRARIKASKRMQELAKNLKENVSKEKKWLDSESFRWIHIEGWTPFWSSQRRRPKKTEEQLYEHEVDRVVCTLKGLQKEEDFIKGIGQTPEEVSQRLLQEAKVMNWEGYRYYVCFVLNLVAFYGYAVNILCFYYHEDETQPRLVGTLKFGYPTFVADWTGNFVGDLMWTLEPIMMLVTSALFVMLSPLNISSSLKVKSD